MNPWKYKNVIKMQDNVWLRLIVFTDISLHLLCNRKNSFIDVTSMHFKKLIAKCFNRNV